MLEIQKECIFRQVEFSKDGPNRISCPHALLQHDLVSFPHREGLRLRDLGGQHVHGAQSLSAACAAARRAIGTRNGEQLT